MEAVRQPKYHNGQAMTMWEHRPLKRLARHVIAEQLMCHVVGVVERAWCSEQRQESLSYGNWHSNPLKIRVRRYSGHA